MKEIELYIKGEENLNNDARQLLPKLKRDLAKAINRNENDLNRVFECVFEQHIKDVKKAKDFYKNAYSDDYETANRFNRQYNLLFEYYTQRKVIKSDALRVFNEMIENTSLIKEELNKHSFSKILVKHLDDYSEKEYLFAVKSIECKNLTQGENITAECDGKELNLIVCSHKQYAIESENETCVSFLDSSSIRPKKLKKVKTTKNFVVSEKQKMIEFIDSKINKIEDVTRDILEKTHNEYISNNVDITIETFNNYIRVSSIDKSRCEIQTEYPSWNENNQEYDYYGVHYLSKYDINDLYEALKDIDKIKSISLIAGYSEFTRSINLVKNKKAKKIIKNKLF